MKMNSLVIIVTFALSLLNPVYAGFVQIDWKTEGDNRASLDESSGLEWLKLNETINMSINQVKSELVVGGLFEGWRLPTSLEMNAASESHFPVNVLNNTAPYTSSTNTWTRGNSFARLTPFSQAFGLSYVNNVAGNRTMGLYI